MIYANDLMLGDRGGVLPIKVLLKLLFEFT